MMVMVGEHDELVIGLTAQNFTHLRKGEPASVDGPHPVKVQRIIVMYGETKRDILRQLDKAGIELTDVMRQTIEADPS